MSPRPEEEGGHARSVDYRQTSFLSVAHCALHILLSLARFNSMSPLPPFQIPVRHTRSHTKMDSIHQP